MTVRPAAASSVGPFVGLLWSGHARRGRNERYSQGIPFWCLRIESRPGRLHRTIPG